MLLGGLVDADMGVFFNDLLVTLLEKVVPFIGREGTYHLSEMDQVELIPPGPFFEDVVYFHDAVWRKPVYWRREEIYTSDRG